MDYVKLGYLLQKAREEKNIRQKEIACILDVTTSNISSWERGKSKIDIASFIKVCDVYQIKVLDVLNNATNNIQTKEAEPTAENALPTLPTDEQKLLDNYNQLNEIGKERLLETSEELTEMAKYKKDDTLSGLA